MEKNFHVFIEIAQNHIQLAKKEISECSTSLSKHLEDIDIKITDQEVHQQILNALTSLQLVDIITQRLDKLANFLNKLDKNTIITEDELEEFAWENEVNQNEIDNFFNKG